MPPPHRVAALDPATQDRLPPNRTIPRGLARHAKWRVSLRALPPELAVCHKQEPLSQNGRAQVRERRSALLRLHFFMKCHRRHPIAASSAQSSQKKTSRVATIANAHSTSNFPFQSRLIAGMIQAKAEVERGKNRKRETR